MSRVTQRIQWKTVVEVPLCVFWTPLPPPASQEVQPGLAAPQRWPSFAPCPWGVQPPTFMQSQQALIVGSAYKLNSS